MCNAFRPAFVDNAHWKREVAASCTFPICWAIVRETNLRTTSPATMPLTPPSGFVRAVNKSKRNHPNRHHKHVRSRQSGTNADNNRIPLTSLRKGRKCSVVMPDGPPAVSLREDRGLQQN